MKDQAVEVNEVEVKEASSEQVAFNPFARRTAVDYIEHVLNGVRAIYFDKEPVFHYIKIALSMARGYASLVPNSDDKHYLEERRKTAEKNYQCAKAYNFGKPTLTVLDAVRHLLKPDGEFSCSAVKTLCLDAAQAWAKEQGISDAESVIVREQELAWQESRAQLKTFQCGLRTEPDERI